MNRSKYREYVPRTCTCGVLSGGDSIGTSLTCQVSCPLRPLASGGNVRTRSI